MNEPSPAAGFRIGALVSIVRAAISDRVRARLNDEGFTDVSPAQEVALQTLAPQGMRLTELAVAAGMAKQSMAYLVEQLEQAGYLVRVPDPADARAKVINRTERGWAYQKIAATVVTELEAEWSALLGAGDFAEMKRHLGRIAAALGVSYRGSVAEASNRRAAGAEDGQSFVPFSHSTEEEPG